MTPALQEALYQCARNAMAMGDAKLKSWSGADQADSELDFGASRVYVAIAGYTVKAFAGTADGRTVEGLDVETAIANEDARWRAYAAEQAAKVAAAPKIKRGPSQGHSVISHRWDAPEAFRMKAIHIRTMVRILTERQERHGNQATK